ALARLAPDDLDALQQLGLSLYLRGDYDEAGATFRAILRRFSCDGWANVGVERTLRAEGDVEAAGPWIGSSLKKGVAAYALWLDLAEIRQARGDRDGAKAALAKAGELAGRVVSFESDVAWSLATFADRGLRDPDLALRLARDAAERHPRRAGFQ